MVVVGERGAVGKLRSAAFERVRGRCPRLQLDGAAVPGDFGLRLMIGARAGGGCAAVFVLSAFLCLSWLRPTVVREQFFPSSDARSFVHLRRRANIIAFPSPQKVA